MPPALIASKAFAMNANNDMGNMIKQQVCGIKYGVKSRCHVEQFSYFIHYFTARK